VTVLRTIDLLDEFDRCRSAEELWATFLAAIEPLGLQSTMYLQGVPADDINETCYEAQTRCETLLGTLISDEFVECVTSDPDLRQIDYYSRFWKQSLRPFAFRCTSDADCPDAVRPLNRVMHDHGARGGLVVPLRGFGSGLYGNAGFICGHRSAVGADDLPVESLTALAHYLNGHMVAALHRRTLGLAELSNRERECLQWLAAGLGTKQLSERMGISLDTANEYIGKARRKMRAQSRAEAVARAVALRMIDL
jgi:DNA-binding CsgD family transcriptional regulator